MGMMNVLMQLRKVCNHPDLFEPRLVVTPFSMEPLSFSTASCVINAIQPKSGLERSSSYLLLPLWSMGHGLPSLNSACTMDDILVEQLAHLAAPDSLIVEREKTHQSSEPKPKPDNNSGLASFLTRIRDLDVRYRRDKAHFTTRINKRRCHPVGFIYSNRLQKAIEMDPLPLNLPLFNEMTASQIAMTPFELLAMKKTHEQRAEELNELIDKFVFCVPKAGTTGKPILFSSSATASSPIEKYLTSKTSGAFTKYFSAFQKANLRLTLCFPDKKLVQFDAGKLQALAKLLRDLKQNNHRVLIFTQMSRMVRNN